MQVQEKVTDRIPVIKEEPIVLLEEVKIQSVVDEKKQKQWIQENIKNLPPINATEDQRREAREKLEKIKQLKTNTKNNPL